MLITRTINEIIKKLLTFCRIACGQCLPQSATASTWPSPTSTSRTRTQTELASMILLKSHKKSLKMWVKALYYSINNGNCTKRVCRCEFKSQIAQLRICIHDFIEIALKNLKMNSSLVPYNVVQNLYKGHD